MLSVAKHHINIRCLRRSTGSAAIQIAKKIIGAKRVIGIAGGPAKCAWVEKIGADICLDYRAPDFHQQLIEATDGFVDIYLDHVGGDRMWLLFVQISYSILT
jgi:NADPH-dependent curcumin reductase CurA